MLVQWLLHQRGPPSSIISNFETMLERFAGVPRGTAAGTHAAHATSCTACNLHSQAPVTIVGRWNSGASQLETRRRLYGGTECGRALCVRQQHACNVDCALAELSCPAASSAPCLDMNTPHATGVPGSSASTRTTPAPQAAARSESSRQLSSHPPVAATHPAVAAVGGGSHPVLSRAASLPSTTPVLASGAAGRAAAGAGTSSVNAGSLSPRHRVHAGGSGGAGVGAGGAGVGGSGGGGGGGGGGHATAAPVGHGRPPDPIPLEAFFGEGFDAHALQAGLGLGMDLAAGAFGSGAS